MTIYVIGSFFPSLAARDRVKINMQHKFSCLAMAFVCSPYHRGSTQSSDMINITKCKEQRQL
jgi:hypothetical protein